jgi:hypothetical protein
VGYKCKGGKSFVPEIYGSIFGLFGRPYLWLGGLRFGFCNFETNETPLRLNTTVAFRTGTFGLTSTFVPRIRNLHPQ